MEIECKEEGHFEIIYYWAHFESHRKLGQGSWKGGVGDEKNLLARDSKMQDASILASVVSSIITKVWIGESSITHTVA